MSKDSTDENKIGEVNLGFSDSNSDIHAPVNQDDSHANHLQKRNTKVPVGASETNHLPLLNMDKTEMPSLDQHVVRSRVVLDRPVYTNAQLKAELGFDTPQKPPFKTLVRNKCEKECRPSPSCCVNFIFSIFPILSTLKTYQVRQWLVNDVIAGLSVAILHIPQGMAFALLTSVSPVYGIYSSFFPVLIYMFFGTSRHITIGTMALISILIGEVVDREVTHYKDGLPANVTLADDSTEIVQLSIGVACAVSLLAGLFQIGISLLRLGVVIVYLSDAFVGGFTTGAAFHIATSQVPSMFGISIPAYVGPLNIVYKYVAVFSRIAQTNVASIIIAIVTAIILIFFKECINDRFKSKMRIPIPVEILIVIVMTIVSHFCELRRHFAISIVGDIPTGFPMPTVPPLERSGTFVVDAFITAIISLVISISLAKVFTKKYDYKIDTNQEMLGYGIAHTISSFFLCFAGAAAPPRCMVFEGCGGKTQLANLFSSILVLLVMLFMGPLLYSLPKAVLAVLIVISLKGMFWQLKQLRSYWKKDKYDFVIWLCTWLAVVFLDITYGLIVGVGISFLTVVLRTQLSSSYVLEYMSESDIYVPQKYFKKVSPVKGVCIFHYEAPICFTNAEFLKMKMYKAFVNPEEITSLLDVVVADDVPGSDGIQKKAKNEEDATPTNDTNGNIEHDPFAVEPRHCDDEFGDEIKAIILSCSSVPFVDSLGCNVLMSMKQKYAKVGINFILAGCNHTVLQALERNGFFEQFGDDTVYISIHDAVASVKHMSDSTSDAITTHL